MECDDIVLMVESSFALPHLSCPSSLQSGGYIPATSASHEAWREPDSLWWASQEWKAEGLCPGKLVSEQKYTDVGCWASHEVMVTGMFLSVGCFSVFRQLRFKWMIPMICLHTTVDQKIFALGNFRVLNFHRLAKYMLIIHRWKVFTHLIFTT